MKGIKDLDPSYVQTIANLLNEEDSEYDKVFKAAMNKFKISSPDQLGSDEKKKEFFDYVDSQYTSDAEKNESYNGNINEWSYGYQLVDKNGKKLNSIDLQGKKIPGKIEIDGAYPADGLANFFVKSGFIFKITRPGKYFSVEIKDKKKNVIDTLKYEVTKDSQHPHLVDESYASDYKKRFAQNPEEDMTEQSDGPDWRDDNEYGDAAKKAVDETTFFEKKFPTRRHKIIDNADIYSIMTRGSKAPTYYEAFTTEQNLSERAEYEEEVSDAEPVSQSGLDAANAEPNSAVGFRNDPIPPKRVDVLCDIDNSDPNNPKKTYRLWCQYPVGLAGAPGNESGVAIVPPPHEPGVKYVEDLALFNVPGASDAIARVMDVPKNRSVHRGVNESNTLKKDSDILKWNKIRNNSKVSVKAIPRPNQKVDFELRLGGTILATKVDLGKDKFDYFITDDGENFLKVGKLVGESKKQKGDK